MYYFLILYFFVCFSSSFFYSSFSVYTTFLSSLFLSFFFSNFYLQKSSFSKFDALQKKNILHVRSSDAGKAQEKFNVIVFCLLLLSSHFHPVNCPIFHQLFDQSTIIKKQYFFLPKILSYI